MLSEEKVNATYDTCVITGPYEARVSNSSDDRVQLDRIICSPA